MFRRKALVHTDASLRATEVVVTATYPVANPTSWVVRNDVIISPSIGPSWSLHEGLLERGINLVPWRRQGVWLNGAGVEVRAA